MILLINGEPLGVNGLKAYVVYTVSEGLLHYAVILNQTGSLFYLLCPLCLLYSNLKMVASSDSQRLDLFTGISCLSQASLLLQESLNLLLKSSA